MKKNKSILLSLICLLTISLSMSCSSAFTATISGTVKTEPRDNSSAQEQSNLADANVYIFFNEDEWTAYKAKWDNYNSTETRSIITTIAMPTVSKNIRTTTTNPNGGFSIKTMWNTNAPLFGKDGDEKNFHIAVYHKDYGMFFDETKYSVFSDSSQNISFICQYNEKQKETYTITFNLMDYSNNNEVIDINSVNPKVVIKYKLLTTNNIESGVGEITQVYENIPTDDNGQHTSNKYSFICDKYLYDSSSEKYIDQRVYPVGTIYFYDKGAEGEKTFRMSDEYGSDLSQLGTSFTITKNSNNLQKDIYVDRLNRDYRVNFNIDYPQDNDTNDYSGTPPTLQNFAPKTTIKVYYDGYNKANNDIEAQNSIIEASEEYKTFTFSSDEVPEDGYYSFNLNRMFTSTGEEVFPQITYLLEDDENDIEYVQTNIDGLLINEENTFNNTLTKYSIDNYSTTCDTYLDRVKLKYSIQFNLEDFEDGNTITIESQDNASESTFDPNIKLLILPYNGDITEVPSLDFSKAITKNPDDRINNNTFSFDWDKYDSDGNIQYPAIKYFIYDSSNPLYCQVSTQDNVNFAHIKDINSTINNVETLAFKKGILNENVSVDMEKLEENYSLSFTLNDIEDNNNEVNFNTFSPKVKFNIYKDSYSSSNLISTKYFKQTNSNGRYLFTWGKYGEDVDLVDLPNNVNQDRTYPLVQYYLFNTDSDSYQMLKNNSVENQVVVEEINNAPYTSLFSNDETNKDIDVYIRTKKIKFNLSFNLINIATNNEISLSNINPIIKISYNNGEENVVDTFNNIPSNEIYKIDVTRGSNPSIDTDIKVELIDKRDEVRYRLSSNDPNNNDENLRFTVGESESNRYKESFTLTKANDNELKLYIKDYQYLSSIDIEGRYIANASEDDNDHTVWLIPEISSTFNQADATKLSSPTHTHYRNTTDTYNPSNVENGYFSTAYTQNRIASFDQYQNNSKYLTQRFKIVVNKIKNETNPTLDIEDYMSVVTISNSSSSSEYVYVDNSSTYTTE